MSSIDLYGTPVEHDALLNEGYASPDEYDEQGDTRVVRDLLFSYLVKSTDAAGHEVLSPRDVPRGGEVTVAQIGAIALEKGERNHSFYTTKELNAIRNPLAAAEAVASTSTADLSSLGEFELAEWLKTPNPETGKEPTINEVLEVVGDDKEFAHRMLQAENVATDGEPRKGLETGLSAIIQS